MAHAAGFDSALPSNARAFYIKLDVMELDVRIALTYTGFADPRLTAWLI